MMHGIFRVVVMCKILLSVSVAFLFPHHSIGGKKIIVEDAIGCSFPKSAPLVLFSSSDETYTVEEQKNRAYVDSLLENLTTILDKFILTGSAATKQGVCNILEQIKMHAKDPEMVALAERRIQRAGLSLEPPKKELGKTDTKARRDSAEDRKEWETTRLETNGYTKGRSALSRRSSINNKENVFMGQVEPGLSKQQKFADDKVNLQGTLDSVSSDGDSPEFDYMRKELENMASTKVSKLIASAGSKSGFDGDKIGVGGLDEVLAEVKRRVWTPLAAPPQLLRELGIAPVRGLLFYGKPGCGKSLLARKLGQILSPVRPVTVVSGPEVMDKFVGSSEMKLREIFDSPPDIYETYGEKEADKGEALSKAALHVVIMDEFDAIARHRGGRGGSGDQGDAGVARDSVVNQLLAKLDGVAPLVVPTLVIGLTNKRSLIDSALLRPGRFEVQIEVPLPRTVEQRISILKVHTRHMYRSGRLLVRDAPAGTTAADLTTDDLPEYDTLLKSLAKETDGYSGASLAAIARAAASHALQRSVEDFTQYNRTSGSLLADCVVTLEDFEKSKMDFRNMDETDFAQEEEIISNTE